MPSLPSILFMCTLLCIALFSYETDLYAQQITSPPFVFQAGPAPENNQQPAEQKKMPNVYAHVYGGAGLSWLACDDVKSIIGDDFGIGLGLPSWSYGIRCGFRNILQIEYNWGKSDHDFNNNSIIKDIPSEVIKMDYDTKEIQLKINPMFWKVSTNANGFTKAFFLVGGVGDVEWRDTAGDGFEGTSNIFGVEYAYFSKNFSLSFSLKRYGIEFDETTLFGYSFADQTDAADYIFEIKIGAGIGK